jgi:hypothetical protein
MHSDPAVVINQLAARLMFVELALHEVLRALPADARTGIAAGLRQRAASAMQVHADHFSFPMDEAATLALAALLEAAGEPPKR